MKKYAFFSLAVLAMVSCSKEELATGNQGNESDDEMVYVDVTASMPECQDPVSRTEVDGLGESNISLKWSAADTKAYGMTIYQKEGAYVMGNPSFNATPSADGKTLSFIAGFNNPKKAYLVYPQLPKDNSNNTMTFALNYNQSKSTFSKNNLMLTEFDKTKPEAFVTYKHEISMLKVVVQENDKRKTLESVSFFPKAIGEGGKYENVLNSKITLGVSEQGELTKTYERPNPSAWIKYNLDKSEQEKREFVFCILPPAQKAMAATEAQFNVKYTDGTVFDYTLVKNPENKFLDAFNALEAGQAMSIILPGYKENVFYLTGLSLNSTNNKEIIIDGEVDIVVLPNPVTGNLKDSFKFYDSDGKQDNNVKVENITLSDGNAVVELNTNLPDNITQMSYNGTGLKDDKGNLLTKFDRVEIRKN